MPGHLRQLFVCPIHSLSGPIAYNVIDKTLCWAACSPHAPHVVDLIRQCPSADTGLR